MPNDPQNVQTLFLRLVELPPADRPAALDRECGSNVALRQRVEGLLKAHEESDSLLNRSSDQFDATVLSDADNAAHTNAAEDAADDRLPPGGPKRARSAETAETYIREESIAGAVIADRYTMVQKIGEGGMGEVWVAKQTSPVKRKVALKLIKTGMDSRAVLQRFEQERQALALMDHPNIAKVLDGGITPTGQPFFVMELVSGLPLTKFCDEMKLTPKARLELFVLICQAVQHAHQKGIVHRDLKPANILVTMIDGKPVPKVIDFGVAKATSGKLTEETISTGFGAVVGTLEYMSPEQAGFSGEDIDTRADIYSLGVILYELLTGLRPIDVKRLRNAALTEMIRIIQEEEPSRPSTRLSTNESLPSIAAMRQTEPNKLMALLRGELDWVVMKCLEKPRDRRYETVNALARDVQRYLADEVVEARPPSAGYQLQKFIRRHKGQVIATSLILLALVGGVIGTTRGLFEAKRQERLADARRVEAENARKAEAKRAEAEARERQRAEKAETEAKARANQLKVVSDFQAGMLAQVDPTKAGDELSEDVTARFAETLAKAKPPLPEEEKQKQLELFKSQWHKVNATDAARTLIDRTILKPALATIDQRFNDQPTVDAQLRQVLADRYKDLGLYDAALPPQTIALATRRRELGEDHPDTLNSMDGMGTLLQAQGKRTDAEPYLRETLKKRRSLLGEEHPDTLASIINLGDLLREQNKLSEAEGYIREGIEKCRRVLGEEHIQTIGALSNMAVLLKTQGKLAEAEPFSRETAEKRRRVLGEDHPSTLLAIGNLGDLLRAEGKLSEAEPYLREAMEKRRRIYGEDHLMTLNAINNLGTLLRMQDKPAEAEPFFRESLAKLRRMVGEDHPATLVLIGNLGASLMEQGKMTEAEPLLREAVEKRQRILGKDHPSTLISLITLGSVLDGKGAPADAEVLLAENEPRFRTVFASSDPWQFANSLMVAGKARAKLKRFVEAEANFLEAYPIYVKTRSPNHKDAMSCATALVSLYDDWEKAEPGKGYAAKSAAWQRKLDELEAPAAEASPPNAADTTPGK